MQLQTKVRGIDIIKNYIWYIYRSPEPKREHGKKKINKIKKKPQLVYDNYYICRFWKLNKIKTITVLQKYKIIVTNYTLEKT